MFGKEGVWVLGRTWSFSYWPPNVWHPLGIRLGWYGREGWWGAAAFHRDGHIAVTDPIDQPDS